MKTAEQNLLEAITEHARQTMARERLDAGFRRTVPDKELWRRADVDLMAVAAQVDAEMIGGR